MARVAHCVDGAYDADTGECAAIVWQEQAGGILPPLSVEDAHAIGGAIAVLWVVAFAWREIGRMLRSSEPNGEKE